MRGRHSSRIVILTAAVAVVVSSTLGMTSMASTAADTTEQNGPPGEWTAAPEDLGAPIRSVLSPDQAIGEGVDGEPLAFFFSRGNDEMPSDFAVFDLRKGEVIFDERVPIGKDGWAVEYSPAEKAVYFGVTNGPGELYRYDIATKTIDHLGQPLAGEQIWALAAAPDGVVYGGTYPGGHVFSYDPATGAMRDYGPTLGEPYVRSLEVTDDVVWAGTQGVARLAEIDRDTGATTEIRLPEAFRSRLVTYDLFHVRDDRLIVRTETAPETEMHVFDLESRTFVDTIEEAAARVVSPVDPRNGVDVYLRVDDGPHSGTIVRYDLDALTHDPTGWAPNIVTGDFAWVDMDHPDFPGRSLAVTYYNAQVHVYNPTTRQQRSFDVPVEGAMARLATIGAGPDGNVYVSGQPGQARWLTGSGTFERLPGGGNTQDFGSWGPNLLLGKYPGAGLQVYDTARPWGEGNPAPSIRIGDRQDRPLGFAAAGDRVAVGSAAESGHLAGALTLWDPDTGETEVFRNIVPDQSVVSLAYDERLVWGGTSINGGYGAEPTATQAVLFAFDPSTEQVVYSAAVVPGAETISGLAVHGGRLWGNADGTLFKFDLRARRVLRTLDLGHDTSQLHGRNRGTVVDETGRVYVASGGKLYAVDRPARHAEVIADNAVEDVVMADGDLYYRSGTNLFRVRL